MQGGGRARRGQNRSKRRFRFHGLDGIRNIFRRLQTLGVRARRRLQHHGFTLGLRFWRGFILPRALCLGLFLRSDQGCKIIFAAFISFAAIVRNILGFGVRGEILIGHLLASVPDMPAHRTLDLAPFGAKGPCTQSEMAIAFRTRNNHGNGNLLFGPTIL